MDIGRGAPADRRPRRLRARSCRRGATRSPATLQRIYRARAPPAQARRLRRGRGGAGDPRRRLLRQPAARHRHPASAARTSSRRTPSNAGIDLDKHGIEIINARLSRRNGDLCRLSLRAPAAQGLPVPRLPAPDQQRPQPFRRLHGGAGRRRRAWSPASPATIRPCSTTSAASSTPSPATASSASRSRCARGRTVLVADTAVHDMPNAEQTRRHRRGGGRRRAPHGLRAARRDARLFDLRPSAGRALRTRPARR